MGISDKTKAELLMEIRDEAWFIGNGSEKIPMEKDCLLRLQSHSQRLTDLCAVLRGRLEATHTTLQESE